MIDAWLLEAFPGRTLEELDGMDLNRMMRAKAARSMEVVEPRRRLFLAGELEAKAISASEWRLIVAMDEIEAQ